LPQPFEPRFCLEPFKDLARFGQQRLRVLGASVRGEPFGVFKPRDGQVEGNRKLLEQTGRPFEQALCLLDLPSSCNELRAEVSDLRVQELGAHPRREPLDNREQVVGVVEPV
jgi:hypothetical protein